MKKPFPVIVYSVLLLTGLFYGCNDHVGSTSPVLARIAKKFTVRLVEENNVIVYTKGAPNNIRPGYVQFLLDLSTPPGATLREFDANTFMALKWIVLNDNRLILQGLTPQPSGTNGTVEFTINSLTDTELVITRVSASDKTGGLIVKYTLTTQ
ncbi:MAG: hypothetical protein LH606_11230 [Cytophagaceae bacterium]|nr:hypothetical protein [Cytophagaceae bacterium]